MPERSGPDLNRLAEAVAAGETVDWASTESSAADESDRRLIRELSVIAAISAVHANPASAEAATIVSRDLAAGAQAGPLGSWGPFQLLEKVGEGAHGEVYRAWDRRLDREVALKLLPADILRDVSRATAIVDEGRLLAKVHHPNVVTIYGAEQIGARVGLWMEFIRGRTLERVLDERGVFAGPDAIAVGLELCRAVSAVHEAGLIHRDIKPHNVMLADDGRVALMDFGTGRTLADEAAPGLAGTPLYLAPEVLRGEPPTVQSDIYSLGVLLWRLVTGSYPVRGTSMREIREAHGRGDPIALRAARPDVSPALARAIERAIAPTPGDRHETAGALADDLMAARPRPARVRAALAAGAVAAVLAITIVVWEAGARDTGAADRPSAWLARAVAAATVDEPVVAVLPFANLDASGGGAYVVDGMSEDLARILGGVQGLQVVAGSSSAAFKDRPRDLRGVGERLGANLVVEGSVGLTGGRAQVDVRLAQLDGVALWSERFDRPVDDIFSIQADISRAVVGRLRLALDPERLTHTTSLQAYESYVRGRELVARRGLTNAQKAAALFERAIELDPDFASAHAGLTHAQAFLSFPYRGTSFESAYPTMRKAAVRAIALDPLLADAHAAMGWVYAYERDWTNAERSFRRAIELNPSLTQTYTSYSISTLMTLHKGHESLRLLRQAARRDPLSLDLQREIGEALLFSGQYAAAAEAFRRVMDVEPDFPFVPTYLAKALTFAGRPEEALTSVWEPLAIWRVAALVRVGNIPAAERLAAEQATEPFPRAITSAVLGDVPRALEAIERVAAAEPHRIGRLLIEPELAPLRSHPRVVAIRRAFNLP